MSPVISNTVLSQGQLFKDAGIAGSIGTAESHNHESNITVLRARHKFNQVLRWYVLTDVLAIVVGFAAAWNLARVTNWVLYSRPLISLSDFDTFRIVCFFALAAGAMLRFQSLGHYRVRMNFWLGLKNVYTTMAIAMMMDGFLDFAGKQGFSRLWVISGWMFAASFIVLFRRLLRGYLRRKGLWQVRTLLVGSGNTANDTRAALSSEKSLGYVITAQVKSLPLAFVQAGRSWERLCAQHNVDYVVVALDGLDLEKAEQPIAQLIREAIPFSISPPRRHLPVLNMVPQYFFNHDVELLTHSSGLLQPMPRFIKRAFDIAVSGTLLLIASPALLAIAVMTKFDGGPALFGHKRIGKNGKFFNCLKFRSMIANSEDVLVNHLAENPEARAEWEADHKLKNDPRVTRLGDFLRKTSLDELPQLINVLRGDMSLVGPRPIVMAEVPKYDFDIAHYYRVSPGITGLWQVSGRNDVTYAQRVQMDSWYVRNWSLWHDIAILFKTVPALLKRDGAY